MGEETARWTRVGVPASGTEVSPAERPRGNERAAGKSEDTNHGRVTDLRRLTGEPRPQSQMHSLRRTAPSARDDGAQRGVRCGRERVFR